MNNVEVTLLCSSVLVLDWQIAFNGFLKHLLFFLITVSYLL